MQLAGWVGGSSLNTATTPCKLSGTNCAMSGTDIAGYVKLLSIIDDVVDGSVDSILDVNYSDPRAALEDGTYFYFIFRDDNYFGVFVPDDPDLPTSLSEHGALDGTTSFLDGPQSMCWSASGRYIYVPCWNGDLLEIVDVDDPSSPARVGTGFAPTGISNPTGCCRVGDVLFLIYQDTNTVAAIDVSTENSPNLTPLGTLVDAVNIVNARALIPLLDPDYIGITLDDAFGVIDVSDPSSMSLVGQVAIPAEPATGQWPVGGAEASDGRVYVPCGDDDSVQIIDPSDPSDPVILGELQDSMRLNDCRGIWYYEDEL